MSTTTNTERRNENNDRVDDNDNAYSVDNNEDRMNLSSDNDTDNSDDSDDSDGSDGSDGSADSADSADSDDSDASDDSDDSNGNDLSVVVDNVCVEEKESYVIDEEYDIYNDKKIESNDSMTNYAERFTELVNRKESVDTILQFIEKHPVVAQQMDSNGYYPLDKACRFKRKDDRIIMKLIELYKIAVTIPNKDGYYPLQTACMCNQSENSIMKLIEIFPDAANNSLKSSGSYSALYFACHYTSFDKVIRTLIDLNQTILQHGEDKDRYCDHPIHIAIDENQSNEVIEHILNADPFSIRRQNANGQSPLHMKYPDRLNIIFVACMKSRSDIPINMRDNNEMTPLLNAIILNKDDMVEYMLQYPGIDVNAKEGRRNDTPLQKALYAPHKNIIQQLLDHPCIRLDEKNKFNETPLDYIHTRIRQIWNTVSDYRCCDDEDSVKPKLSEYFEVKKLLEDFPVKRRWQAFVYLFRST